MKPKVEVIKISGEWKVEFTIGVQTFQLAYSGTKVMAKWYAKMLKKAFSNLQTNQNESSK